MKKKKKILRIFGYVVAVLLIVIAVCVFLYPTVNKMFTDNKTQSAINDFQSLKAQAQQSYSQNSKDVSGTNDNQNSTTDSDTTPNFQQLYKDMQDYNANIYKNGQRDLKDAWSYEQSNFNMSQYGIESGAVGELRIPKIDVDLPLYLGASPENMANGAAQLGQTSMPIGGENTNCVIAGHRGYAGAKYFLDIELLEVGDKVYIDNLWDTLTYRVDKIEIIDPYDISKVHIQKNRDMVTLVTCHPYPYNYQRYVVYCERDESTVIQTSSDITVSTPSSTPTPSIVETETSVENSSRLIITLDYTLYLLVPVVFIILAFFLFIKPRKKKNKTDKE